jgi:hypothetical protein
LLKAIRANKDIIEKTSRVESEKLFKTYAQQLSDKLNAQADVLLSDTQASWKQLTYVKHLCEKINSEACVEKIVKLLQGRTQKLLPSGWYVEADIPGSTAAPMSRVQSQSPFLSTFRSCY